MTTEATSQPLPLRSFYVSMSKDLLGVYIHFQAPSERAVRRYLEREYLTASGVWKIPWCAIYEERPVARLVPVYIVDSYGGPLMDGE